MRGISTPSPYLMSMPRKVLFGTAAAIVPWCQQRGKVPPTLLDLSLARKQARRESSARRKER